MHKLQWALSAFGDEIDSDLTVQLETLTKNNIHHLEIRSVWGKNILELSAGDISRVKKELKQFSCSISAIGSPIGKVDIHSDFAEHLTQFERALEVAGMLGTEFIRIFSFYVQPGKHEIYREEVIDRIGKLTSLAAKRGVTLLHENEKGIYGDTAKRCLDLLETINSPHLKATFDSANFVQVGEEPFPKAYEILKPWIAYIHVKDALFTDGQVTVAGEGDSNYDMFIERLVADGYRGFLSIEPHLDNSEPGGGVARFAEAYNALIKLINRHSGVYVS